MGMKIIEITEYNDPGLDIFIRMNENQLFHYYEPDEGIFIAESPKVIGRALRAGYEPLSALAEKKTLDRDIRLLAEEAENEITGIFENIPIYAAVPDVMEELPGYSLVRGLRCAFRRKKRIPPWDAAADVARRTRENGEHARIAVIESVMNPTNVGAIFRSAAAMGLDAVIITTDSSDPLYRRAARVSMGTVFQIPWTYVGIGEWIRNGPEMLRKLGYTVVSMALRNDTIDINDPVLKKKEKLVIVLGSEGPGLREGTIQKSDLTVRIPMAHGVDSLNVAAASAIAFWELGK